MRYRFEIIIKTASGETYSCNRFANDAEQAAKMVKVPDGEKIVEIIKHWERG